MEFIPPLCGNPWGRRRNPNDWNDLTEPTLFTRGFTGHEHIGLFGLINMNGRMYDPRLGRFLSPDPYVQAPDFSQSFNRYSYVWNNPLKYTDPDGEFVFTIIGALLAPVTGGASLAIGIAMDVGGGINLGIKAYQRKINNFGDGLAAYGIGAAAGAIGYATGGAAFAMAGGAAGGAGGFLAGFAGGAMGSAFAMPVQSIGNTMYFGDPMITGKQYLMGIAFGGLMGGSINGAIALHNNRSFLTGIKNYELTSPGRVTFDPNAGRQGTRLNTDGMRSELRSIPSRADDGIYYFENAKSAVRFRDGIPVEAIRDGNFRNNLIQASGVNSPSNVHAHHVFPLKYAADFQRAGINFNSYGSWWGVGHQSNASAYNNAWRSFFMANPGATRSEIFLEALRLKAIFGY